jgi:glycosyltransferase involved in cell wall biosynthesis
VTPVRVLWLVKGLGPGGAERLLVNHAAVRDRDRFDVAAAYLLAHKHHLAAELEALGVPTTCLHGGHEADLRWAWRLRSMIRAGRPDVVHVHSPYVAAVTRLVLRTLPRRRRPALVVTEHNRWPRHDRLTRLANRLTCALDDADLAVSEDVRATMAPRLAARTEVLAHGIELASVRAAATERTRVRAELAVTDDELLVVTVANLRREKALEVLLDAAARLADTPLRFALVGQGPLADELAARHRALGLGDRVLLLGYRPDAPAVLAAGDAFCLSSRHEGRPVALLEALALGLPVVATAVGGIPEVVTAGREAALAPPDDPAALADALRSLLDPSRRAAMAAAARAIGDTVGAEPAARRIEELYTDLAASRSRR